MKLSYDSRKLLYDMDVSIKENMIDDVWPDTVHEIGADGIYVCPLSYVEDTLITVNASHLVTLINHDTMIDTPPMVMPDNHLRLAMNDIIDATPGLVPPGQEHVEELIDFTTGWDRKAPMLIHCWAGISRSTAAAFIALCVLNPDVSEIHIAKELRKASPTAYPNRRLVTFGDELLGRSGRMVEAVQAIGRGEMAIEGRVFGLPADIVL